MPLLETADLRVHYALRGPEGAPAVLFSSSLGATLSVWDAQAAALEARFRVLRYDTRGHGLTSVTPGPSTIARLGSDVVELLDGLGIERCHFCGLSIGGMIGIWLGIHAAERVERLVLCNTAARIGTPERWTERIQSVRTQGMSALAPDLIERWFTAEFRARSPEVVASALAMLESAPPEGYVACCEALRDADLRSEIAAIRAPTLVIAGSEDPATPPAEGRFLADRIAGAEYVELPTSHLSNLAAPDLFNAELARFLA